jgi:23S rRNA (cytidine1920-2'-O)/16S rRNA (cytidine1409-2'-O)-methyltransferase
MRTSTGGCRKGSPIWTNPEVTAKPRLDSELVRRGLARSRQDAQDLVAAGRVRVAGLTATKVATAVDPAVSLTVDRAGAADGYVSRGGDKLAGALADLGGPEIAGRRCLDAGVSTGGFTDVLLRAGAAHVIGVDVGYGQIAWSLRTDARVTVMERTNVRMLGLEAIGEPVDVIVADLSFISLTIVLPALTACAAQSADLVVLVKPQFEAGRELVGRGGVVRDPAVRFDAVCKVSDAASNLGLGVRGCVQSRLPGPAGNIEYFLWLRRDATAPDIDALRRTVLGDQP